MTAVTKDARTRRTFRAPFQIGGMVMVVLSAAAIVLVQQQPAEAAAPTLVTNRSFLSASAFDGFGQSGETNELESTDEAFFSDSIEAHDEPGGEGAADAFADQTASITSDPGVLRADVVGSATAEWEDFNPGDADIPEAEGRSEFSITFEVTEPTAYSVTGTLSAVASSENVACSFVEVEDPNPLALALGFDAPSGCHSLIHRQSEFTLGGALDPGTYRFSIKAVAAARNPDEAAGSASVSFEAALTVGCTNPFTPGNDIIQGTLGDDVLCGGGGVDTITGLGGADVIIGGDDGDTINGGPDDDLLLGDDPADSAATGIDVLEGEGGGDELLGGPEGDVLDGGDDPDLLIGAGGVDTLDGGPLRDDIFGGPGGDTIDGQGGNDELFGEGDQDTIRGGEGDDLIEGGPVKDTLRGGPGSDKLRGQGGNDTLIGNQRKDVLNGGANNDNLNACDGVKDEVIGGPGLNDEAKVDPADDVRASTEVVNPC